MRFARDNDCLIMLKEKEKTEKKYLKIHFQDNETISSISKLSDGAGCVMYCSNIGGLASKTSVDSEGVARWNAALSKINGI